MEAHAQRQTSSKANQEPRVYISQSGITPEVPHNQSQTLTWSELIEE